MSARLAPGSGSISTAPMVLIASGPVVPYFTYHRRRLLDSVTAALKLCSLQCGTRRLRRFTW
jgi:hypothetical protein